MAKTYRHLLSPFTLYRIYHMSQCMTCQTILADLFRRRHAQEAVSKLRANAEYGKPRCEAHGLVACMWCDPGPKRPQDMTDDELVDAVSAYPQMTDSGHEFTPISFPPGSMGDRTTSNTGCGAIVSGRLCMRAEGHPIHHPGWENVAPAVQPGM